VFLPERGAARVKLLDFGVAKWLGALALTGPTQSFGTPAFMAPEQLLSSAAADPRSDVYALGATLYAMLSARAPFAAASEVELYMMVRNDPPAVLPALPAGLATAIARALAKSPAERFGSAAAMIDALRAL
jgi:serine/threonine-protein kinase